MKQGKSSVRKTVRTRTNKHKQTPQITKKQPIVNDHRKKTPDIKKNVILINGFYGSGKDFFAEMLKEKIIAGGKTCQIFSYADPIKTIISKTFDISVDELNDYKNNKSKLYINEDGLSEKYLIDFRGILQRFGTEAMKHEFGDDVWINKTKENIKKSGVDFAIISDFRFKEEAIPHLSTIHIFNDEIETTDSHISENDLIEYPFEHFIDNTGQKDLTEQVEYIYNTIIK